MSTVCPTCQELFCICHVDSPEQHHDDNDGPCCECGDPHCCCECDFDFDSDSYDGDYYGVEIDENMSRIEGDDFWTSYDHSEGDF